MSFTKEQLREQMLLYAVTDRHWLNGQTLYEQVEEALKGGATFIQLREKDLTEEEFLEVTKKLNKDKNKIDLNKITQILNENGRKKNTFTSPLEVSKEIFNKIYEIGKEL